MTVLDGAARRASHEVSDAQGEPAAKALARASFGTLAKILGKPLAGAMIVAFILGLIWNPAPAGEGSGSEAGFDEWRREVDVNLNGCAYVCGAAIPSMLERGWGRIVNIAFEAL